MPRRARKVITRGSSNTRPKASSSLAEKLRYSFMEGMGRMVSVAKPRKEVETEGKNNEIAEQGSANEEKRREKDDGNHQPLFAIVETRRNEHPELVDDHRRGNHEPERKETLRKVKKASGSPV
jgi:hypothetical protein